MQNRASVNGQGYIEMIIAGDQSGATFQNLYEQVLPLVERLQVEGKPVLGLADLTQKGAYTPGSNKAVMRMLEEVPYAKLAIFGAEAVLKEVTELIILAMAKQDNTKLFANREEAMNWLQDTEVPS
jgi:hypothetical protein